MSTIRDVAEKAGVSPSTVSHVINATRYVSPMTQQRVLHAMTELNYKPNRLARSLRSRQTHSFGVLLPNSANPFFAEVLLGIENACFESGYNIIIGNANDDPARELAYLSVLLSRQVDGILLISTGAYEEALTLLASYQTPVVLVDRASHDDSIDEILTANKEGGILATEYLLSLGHKRIGCVTGPRSLTPSAERVAGYFEAMHKAGVPVTQDLIQNGRFEHESGYKAAQRLLDLDTPPTAVFACNDLMAVGVLYAIHEAGLRVPDDISVIGFDDIPLASYTIPRLTTIAQPGQELGKTAVETLIDRIQEPDIPIQSIVLPVSLIERDTCERL